MLSDVAPLSLEDVQRLFEKPAYVQMATQPSGALTSSDAVNNVLVVAKSPGEKARVQSIAKTGIGIGITTGISWQLNNISVLIRSHQRELDTVYDFGRLMIRDRVVPPVITESRDLYNQEGDYELRLSGAYYKIETQARFSSLAPSWRDYLSFPKQLPDLSSFERAIQPRDATEEKIWKLAVQEGWGQGVEQANLMLRRAFDRMNRDFTGMIRFHTFVMQGKISLPAIASESIAVTKDGKTMAIDETLLRITTLPEFNGSMASWTGVVIPSAYAGPKINHSASEPESDDEDVDKSKVAR